MSAVMVRLDAMDIQHRCTQPDRVGPIGLVEESLSEGSSPADDQKYSPLVDISTVNAKDYAEKERFYAANAARRAQQDKEAQVEFDGLWKGKSGAPRVNPVIPPELRPIWEKAYDLGVVRAAAQRLAQPESERRTA